MYTLSDTRCSSLGVPTNGRPIVYAPDTEEDFDTGTTATFGCLEGFALSQGSVVWTCSIRRWSGVSAICEGIVILVIQSMHIDYKQPNANIQVYVSLPK